MARVYKTKGDAALRAKITVPLTVATLEKVQRNAQHLGVAPTSLARSLIEDGLKHSESKQQKQEK